MTKAEQLGSMLNSNDKRRKQLIKDCDRLFSKLIVENHNCFVCGIKAIELFHLVKREVWGLRWSKENVFPTCRKCHSRWHDGSEAVEWLEDVLPDTARYYQAHRWSVSKEPSLFDLEDLKEELQGKLKGGDFE